MRKRLKLASGIFIVYMLMFQTAVASGLSYSGKTEIWDNPFVAFGFNPKTNFLSGYVAALRTAPGRTDECKLVFAGNYNKSNILSVKYLNEDNGSDQIRNAKASAAVVQEGREYFLRLRKDSLGGECEWILPFIGEPRVHENANEVAISLGKSDPGKWVGVYAIKSARAKFHKTPIGTSVQKAFLVKGDIIFVFDEQGDWYYVEFERKDRKTVGWIRKSDTVQF
jgi:hypothetical protein